MDIKIRRYGRRAFSEAAEARIPVGLGLLVVLAIGLGLACLSKLSYDYDPESVARYATEHSNILEVVLFLYYV